MARIGNKRVTRARSDTSSPLRAGGRQEADLNRTNLRDRRGDGLGVEVAHVEHGRLERSLSLIVVEEDPHAIFSIQFAIGPEVLVVPGSAGVVALGAAVGMFEARPGTEGKLIAAGEHDATRIAENDLIWTLAEETGIEEEGFVGF